MLNRILPIAVIGLISSSSSMASSTVGSHVQPYQGNAVITGVLTADAECVPNNARDEYQVWLSVGQILLYQVDLPNHGSFEFHVRPGKYDLSATNVKGCSVTVPVMVSAKGVTDLILRLKPARSEKPVPAKP